jgi:hypothetical protein
VPRERHDQAEYQLCYTQVLCYWHPVSTPIADEIKKYGTCEEVWNGFAQQTNGKLTKDQLAIGRGGKIVTKSRQINAISSNTLRTSQATSLKQRYVKDTNHLFLIDSIHYKKIYGSREEVWGGDAYKVKVEV